MQKAGKAKNKTSQDKQRRNERVKRENKEVAAIKKVRVEEDVEKLYIHILLLLSN